MEPQFRIAERRTEPTPASFDPAPHRLDPTILRVARQIYHRYLTVHGDKADRPLGIAIDRFTHRGQLVFTERPVLLPQECFISIQQLEAGLFKE